MKPRSVSFSPDEWLRSEPSVMPARERQLRQVAPRVGVEIECARFDELHHGRRREELRAGEQMIGGRRPCRARRASVGVSERRRPSHAAAVHDRDRTARHAGAAQAFADAVFECGQVVGGHRVASDDIRRETRASPFVPESAHHAETRFSVPIPRCGRARRRRPRAVAIRLRARAVALRGRPASAG